MTEDCQRLIRQQTRLLNQLTATLKAYYPRGLEVAELSTALARAFLQAYPTPEAVRQLTERQWQRWARAQHLSASRTTELWAVLQAPQLPVPAHVVRAKARLMQTLVAALTPVLAAVGSYRETIDDFFAGMPAAATARTLPVGERGLLVPTLWARLGDAPGRWSSFRHLQAQAGSVPVTERSGKQQHRVHFRYACDKSLRYVLDHVAFRSLQSSDWARAYYDQQRARGHAHRQALRALGAKWLKIIFVMWRDGVAYSEDHHLANIARHQLRCAATNNRLTCARESLSPWAASAQPAASPTRRTRRSSSGAPDSGGPRSTGRAEAAHGATRPVSVEPVHEQCGLGARRINEARAMRRVELRGGARRQPARRTRRGVLCVR